MRLFVSEYLSSGAWPQGLPPKSLLQEGRSMLTALLTDFARIAECRPVTTWDRRCGPLTLDGVEIVPVDSPSHEREIFRRLAGESDRAYVIAPEFDDILARRCRLVFEQTGRLLGPDQDSVELCSDKLRLAEHFQRHHIPTIPTQAIESNSNLSNLSFPMVVKPRAGAGSLDLFFLSHHEELQQVLPTFTNPSDENQPGILQPYVEGVALSVAAIVSPASSRIDIFPAGEQHLSDEGRFRYLGGRIPAAGVDRDQVDELIRSVCRTIPGLNGYVGFDLLQPIDQPKRLLVVEINPRLTTGYLGYRRLTDDNLAERILFPEREFAEIVWKADAVTYQPAGGVQRAVPLETI